MPSPSQQRPWRVALSALWPEPNSVTLRQGPGRTPGLGFLLLPHASRATLLVPTCPRKATAAALSNYKSPSTRAGRMQSRVLRGMGLTGLANLAPSRAIVSLDPRAENLMAHISELLGEDLIAGIHLGPPRANQKPIIQVLRPSGETVAFAKVGINDLTNERVSVEATALTRLSRTSFSHLVVPELLHRGRWGDCAFVLLAPVQTWTASGIDVAARSRAMEELSLKGSAPAEPLADLPWWNRTRQNLAEHGHASEAKALTQMMSRAEEKWGDLNVDVGWNHGDWTPWNMSTGANRAIVWDWERFAEDIPVGFDALHYAFQAGVRLDGLSPLESLRRLTDESGWIVAQNGAPTEQGQMLLALYLVGVGERFITDGQEKAGAKKGPLASWLVPGLQALVGGSNKVHE